MITRKGMELMLEKTYENLDRFKLGIGDIAESIEHTDLETPIEINSGDYFGIYSEGYPDVDLFNLEVETRFFLSSIEGNDNGGNPITEVALFDNEGNMFSRNLITPINKTDSVEIAFEIIDYWEVPN